MPTTTSMSTNNSATTATVTSHDEYIDYSCSTNVERLARDVETQLRKWHVDQGSDRHVSSAAAAASSATTHHNNNSHTLMIRSHVLDWHVHFHLEAERLDCHLPLQLVLWDGPVVPATTTNTVSTSASASTPTASTTLSRSSSSSKSGSGLKKMGGLLLHHHRKHSNNRHKATTRAAAAVPPPLPTATTTTTTTPDHHYHHLPASLQRRPHTVWPLGAFDNFSTLFGIGQHITLQPTTTTTASGTVVVPNELLWYLHRSVATRHDPASAETVVTSILSRWLQTALNLAASQSQCYLPVLGVWGLYQPTCSSTAAFHNTGQRPATEMVRNSSVNPTWLRPSSSPPLVPTPSRRRYTPSQTKHPPPPLSHHVPAVLSGQLRSEDCTATFTCCVLTADQTWLEQPLRWTTWGSVLQRYCNNNNSSSSSSNGEDPTTADHFMAKHHPVVHLWAARHVYAWYKQQTTTGGPSRTKYHKNSTTSVEWRRRLYYRPEVSMDVTKTPREDVDTYRLACRQVALCLLEHAAGASDKEPLWGPLEDPVACLQAVVTWNGRPASDTTAFRSPSSSILSATTTTSMAREPLLALPITRRSRTSISEQDRVEVEQSVETNLLDPRRPDSFFVKAFFDPEATQAPLAATQRCVLAALIRAATLPRETLLQHLVDEKVIKKWDASAGDHIANALAVRASVDSTTLSLVAAMDWSNAVENMIDAGRAETILAQVLDGGLALEFPSPPDQEAFKNWHMDDWKALSKSAPPGRLLSLLFVHMARVRSPPSMAILWSCFVSELRRRTDCRESLPNMRFVPGLDPPLESTPMKRCFSTIGGKAGFAGHVNCSEPDPDDGHCLVGQKLQVFNICLESLVATEMREIEQLEKRPKLETPFNDNESLSVISNSRTLLNGAFVDGLPEVESFSPLNGDDSSRKSAEVEFSPIKTDDSSKSQQTAKSGLFFDAFDAEERLSGDESTIGNELFARRGARCPVQDTNLASTGDQLYAPYLQRPQPLTDDIIAQRRLMMLAHQTGSKASATVLQRLELTQRLQRPKLLSDMQAFKAANPTAEFQDFINWYGNPDSPLECFGTTDCPDDNFRKVTAASRQMKLDRAAEAIRVLDETRQFWTDTWSQAKPISAVEQETLFDAFGTIEMAIDYLETIHPATLLCQVMAVNLAMAYFSLVVAAGDAVKVGVVRNSLIRFRENVATALEHLAHDATFGDVTVSRNTKDEGLDPITLLVSIESLSACGRACLSLSEAEVLVSRATSLLYKLPQLYSLVDKIMSSPSGTPIEILDKRVRATVLKTASEHTLRNGVGPPSPSIREYMLMNDDDLKPCQLCVRYCDDGASVDGEDCADLILALKTTET